MYHKQEHEYWFTGRNALEEQKADAESGKWDAGAAGANAAWTPLSDEITRMETEGFKSSCTVYRGQAAEEYKKSYDMALCGSGCTTMVSMH